MSSLRKFKIHICTCKIQLYIAQIFTGGNSDAFKVFQLYTQIYPIKHFRFQKVLQCILVYGKSEAKNLSRIYYW